MGKRDGQKGHHHPPTPPPNVPAPQFCGPSCLLILPECPTKDIFLLDNPKVNPALESQGEQLTWNWPGKYLHPAK